MKNSVTSSEIEPGLPACSIEPQPSTLPRALLRVEAFQTKRREVNGASLSAVGYNAARIGLRSCSRSLTQFPIFESLLRRRKYINTTASVV
jgi:hypothetical protein